MKNIIAILFALLGSYASAQNLNEYDLNRPFGWAQCTSLTDGDAYKVTGGAGGKQITLVSDGQDMRQRIMDAIRDYEIVVFDGTGGDFIVSSQMKIEGVANRTIVGINNARICTQFYCTPEIHQMLNEEKVRNISSAAGSEPITLSNGAKVREPREAKIRQLLIDRTNDQKENYRNAGLLNMNAVENVIIRNLTLVGPGAIDVSGADLMTLSRGSRHVWIDHCEFIDGMDGNFDINSFSDFITISWCIFRYTERTFIHANTNLVGSNDNPNMNGPDNLNVTYANCIWDQGCDQRMPMVRFGTIHIMNCLYDCKGNSAAVNPRKDSEVLVDRCHFGRGVKNIFKQNGAKSYEFYQNRYMEQFKEPEALGEVHIPYKYKGMPSTKVSKMLRAANGAGATLTEPLVVSE